MITVRQLLRHKGDTIHSVDPDQPVIEAVRLMAEHVVGALLVMRGVELCGIVSERDYARKVVLRGRSSNDTLVREIMSNPVVTADPQDTVDECMRVMTERRFRHLPVVAAGRVAGVISIGDLVRAVIEEQQRTIQELETYIRS